MIADPEAMLLTYKEGGAAVRTGTSCSQCRPFVPFNLSSEHPQGKVKGIFSLAEVSVKPFACAAQPNAFEVTGADNGVEEKLVLAARDEADARRWIEGLNMFAAPIRSGDPVSCAAATKDLPWTL